LVFSRLTVRSAQLAQSDGWGIMISHRSGETESNSLDK
jgi:enolase